MIKESLTANLHSKNISKVIVPRCKLFKIALDTCCTNEPQIHLDEMLVYS